MLREHSVVLLLLLLVLPLSVLAQRSCKGRCGTSDGTPNCQCEATCRDFGDCCQDFEQHCLTCVGRCGARFDKNQACQCNTNCAQHKNCCEDHATSCQPKVSAGSFGQRTSISSEPITTSDLQPKGSCIGRCGARFDKNKACQCNTNCAQFKNCCEDHPTSCQPKGSSGQRPSVSSGPINPITTSDLQPKGSCVGRCGARFDKNKACQCNTNCAQFKNCCEDHATSCQPKASSGSSGQRPSVSSGPITTPDLQPKGSCVGRCRARFDKNQSCQCNTNCAQFKNCCGDHATTCQPKRSPGQQSSVSSKGSSGQRPSVSSTGSSGQPSRVSSGPITAIDLQSFTEELLQKDVNNVTPQLRINRQGQTNSRAADDKAQEPLVTIPSSALTGPTIVAFRALLNNYDPNVAVKEVESNAESQEQNNFLTEIMKTQIMQHTENFLTTKGKIRRPLKDVLKEIWFTMYKRAGRNEGSSGFEHAFIGEIKDGKVSGFHNWIQFGHEEQDGDLDYKGFMKYVNLGNKGQIIKGRFNWLSDIKPTGSLFVGTSPELEMALYTVCFLVKPDQKCQVKLNNKKVNIQTWTQNYKGKKLVGSAYPDI